MKEITNRSSRSAKAVRRSTWLERQGIATTTRKAIEIPDNATFIVRVKDKQDRQLSKIGAINAYKLRLVRIEAFTHNQVVLGISHHHQLGWEDMEGLLHLIAADSPIAPDAVAKALQSWLGKLVKQYG